MSNPRGPYAIKKHLCVLGKRGAYTKAANLVSWDDGDTKLDIRWWNKDREPCKGITLSESEGRTLYDALKMIYEPYD